MSENAPQSDNAQPNPPGNGSEKREARIQPFNHLLRDEFAEFIGFEPGKQGTISLGQVQADSGISVALLSKYLNKKPVGDVARLENAIGDYMKLAAERVEVKKDLFPTATADEISSIVETICKTNDVGGIAGPAGIGKTCGINAFLVDHATAVKITVTRYDCSAPAMIRLIWDKVDTRAFKKSETTRARFLIKKFQNSNRPLLIDNAHRMTKGAFDLMFDFNDQTGMPICFLGNPEFLDFIKVSDQHFSRIGIYRELRLKEPEKFCQQILDQIAPAHAHEIKDLALKVIMNRGHGRALKKQLLLAAELLRKGAVTFRKAFQMANEQLIGHNYDLEDGE